MQPQTDAEMHAWNYGVDMSTVHDLLPPGPAAHEFYGMPAMSGATRAAFVALGEELFFVWANRGYATAIAQHH